MKTNRFFNFKRFYNLLSYDLRINGKRYLSFLAGGIVIFYLILLIGMINAYQSFEQNNYNPFFLLSLLGLGIFMGSAFPELSSKIKTGNYLLLPASTLEKTASQFLVYIVFGSTLFLLIFWMDAYFAKWTALQMKHIQNMGVIIESFQYLGLLKNFRLSSFWSEVLMVMSVVSAGFFLFTARLFFKRFALVKSTIVLIAVMFSFGCYMVLFSHIFYPETTGFNVYFPRYELSSSLLNYQLYFNILVFPLWIFFLFLAYYKLKEKQV